ncbi:MAG: hypothetical protein KGO98_05815 [Rickettsiales bacterium]|nr:hypothetical protein [Rickettsiales bacterium]
MTQELKKGDVVKLNENLALTEISGYYRITSIRGQYANLGSIFGNTIYHKRMPLAWLVECQNEWYAKWSQSESYMCM